MVSKSTPKSGKMSSKNRIDYLSLFNALYSCTVLIHATLVSFQLKTLEAEYRNRIRKECRAFKKIDTSLETVSKERDLVIKVYSTSLMPNLFSDFLPLFTDPTGDYKMAHTFENRCL